MNWKPNYAIGIDIIDEQHKKLFDIMWKAEELLNLPNHIDKFDEIVSVIEELKDYVAFHFREEEQILLSIKYKKYFGHCVYHQDFIEQMNAIDLNEVDAHQSVELYKLVNLVKEWLIEHVLKEDKEWASDYHQYKACLNE